MPSLKITLLGTGTSQGVPLIGCNCDVCLSEDKRDKRLRSSVKIDDGKTVVVIDTGPDFRYQMLRSKTNRLDAVVLTHDHKDHIAGMDDLRAYNFSMNKPMPIYAEKNVIETVKQELHYVFSGTPYPGIPRIKLIEIEEVPIRIGSLQFIPIRLFHHKLPVLGFRIGNFAYLTDVNRIPESSYSLLKGLDTLVIDALRIEPHISHFSLSEAMTAIEIIEPKKAYLTHICHSLGLHQQLLELLPSTIEPGYDGLEIFDEY